MSLRLALALAVVLSGPVFAQRGPMLEVQLPPAGHRMESAAVSVARALSDPQLQELMRSGFRVELRFRVELWRTGGLFHDMEQSETWDMAVQYDKYSNRYGVARRRGTERNELHTFESLADAEAAIERPFPLLMRPHQAGAQYYYVVLLEVESLSVSELDALQRWLRGDVEPAVKGRGNPFTALRNGIGRLLSRVLGGEKKHYSIPSPQFTAE